MLIGAMGHTHSSCGNSGKRWRTCANVQFGAFGEGGGKYALMLVQGCHPTLFGKYRCKLGMEKPRTGFWKVFRFFLAFSVQRRRVTRFKIHEEHPVHCLPCHIVFVLSEWCDVRNQKSRTFEDAREPCSSTSSQSLTHQLTRGWSHNHCDLTGHQGLKNLCFF